MNTGPGDGLGPLRYSLGHFLGVAGSRMVGDQYGDWLRICCVTGTATERKTDNYGKDEPSLRKCAAIQRASSLRRLGWDGSGESSKPELLAVGRLQGLKL